MVIVHVIIDLATGGAEMMLKRLVEQHRANQHFKHHVISLYSLGTVGSELRAMGVPVEALGIKGALDIPRVLFNVVHRIRELRPDVLHCWMYHANLLGGLAARIGGSGRVVWSIRAGSCDATMGASRLTMWLRRASGLVSTLLPDIIVYVAQAAREAHEALGYSTSKAMVIPNGYIIPDTIPVATARARLGIPADVPVIGSIGRFNEAKDHRTFVEAAALVARTTPEVHFVMFGPGVTSENALLMGWITKHELEGQFTLYGDRRDIEACLFAMDIFCLHSVTEAFPNVVAEAMSAGIPSVITDVGDAALLLGDAGLVVPARNPVALADAVNQLIEAGPDQRAALGKRGRQRIMDHFSIASIVKQYEELYRGLADKSGAFTVTAGRLQA